MNNYMIWYQQKRWSTAKKQVFNGIKYDSGFEANYGQELELRKKAKDIKDFETHIKIPLEVNGYHITNYFIDFIIYHNDETKEYVETKGYQTEVWKMKWKIFCALYEDKPDTKITLIQQGKFKPPKLRHIK